MAYTPNGRQTLTVKDFRGETYAATVLRNANAEFAISADYDLAVLTFTYKGNDLSAIPFAAQDAVKGEEVISLGSPENQSHAITFGT